MPHYVCGPSLCTPDRKSGYQLELTRALPPLPDLCFLQSLFPMSSLSCTIPALSTLGNVSEWAAQTADTESFELTTSTGQVPLKKGLQYGLSNGSCNLLCGSDQRAIQMTDSRPMNHAAFDEVLKPLTKLTQLIHSPPYADPSVVLSLGCTDAVSKTFTLFTDKHSAPNVICEEFSFVASLNTGRSRGLVFHGVKVDNAGMVPADLERLLESWNEAEKGPKPRVRNQSDLTKRKLLIKQQELNSICSSFR